MRVASTIVTALPNAPSAALTAMIAALPNTVARSAEPSRTRSTSTPVTTGGTRWTAALASPKPPTAMSRIR